MDEDRDYRCRRDNRCAHYDLIDTPDGRIQVGAPINVSLGLCLACESKTVDAIHDLPAVYLALGFLLPKGSTAATEYVSASPDATVPIDLGVDTLQRDIVYTATRWAEAVAEIHGIAWDSRLVDRHTRPGVALDRATRLLAAGDSISVLCAIRWHDGQAWYDGGTLAAPVAEHGIDGAITLTDLHWRAECRVGDRVRTYQLPDPCRACHWRTLIHRDGSDTVHCTHCDAAYTWNDRLDMLEAFTAAHHHAAA